MKNGISGFRDVLAPVFALIVASGLMAGAAMAENKRVGVRIEGPPTIDWGKSGDYQIVVTIDGKAWKAFPTVKWRVREGGPHVRTDARNSTGSAKVETGDPNKDFHSRDFILEADVIADTPAGRVRRTVRLKIKASNVARLCGELGQNIKKADDDLSRANRQKEALQRRFDQLKSPAADSDALDAATRVLDEARDDVAAANEAVDAARELVGEIGARAAAVNKVRSTAWRNMTELARYTAANDRWAVSAKTDRDKLAYIRTVFGNKPGLVRTTQNKAQLDQDFEFARNHARKQIVGNVIGPALGGLGTLTVIALPGPKASGGQVAKTATKLVSAYRKVKKAKFYHDLNETSRRLELSDASIRALAQQTGRVRTLAQQYQRAKDRDPDSAQTGSLFRQLMAALKTLNNQSFDALHREQDALDEARKAQRAAARTLTEAKRDMQDRQRQVDALRRKSAQSRREAERIDKERRDLARDLARLDDEIKATSGRKTGMQDRFARHCETKVEPAEKPKPAPKVKCRRRGLVGGLECVQEHIEKGR